MYIDIRSIYIHQLGRSIISRPEDQQTQQVSRLVLPKYRSEKRYIKAGVPQGAVLGPLMFLIYINDIIEGISSNINLFADDTSLFIEVEDVNIAAEV